MIHQPQDRYKLASQEDRCAPRTKLTIPGQLRASGGRAFQTVVHDLSISGFSAAALNRMHEGDANRLIDALDRLVNNHAESILAPDAHLKLASIYASLVKGNMYDQGATLEAINYYEDFLILYPESHLVGEAEKALTQMREIYAQSKLRTANYYYIYRKNQRAAINFYNETITVAPNSEAAKIAKTKIEAINRGERPARKLQVPDSRTHHCHFQYVAAAKINPPIVLRLNKRPFSRATTRRRPRSSPRVGMPVPAVLYPCRR